MRANCHSFVEPVKWSFQLSNWQCLYLSILSLQINLTCDLKVTEKLRIFFNTTTYNNCKENQTYTFSKMQPLTLDLMKIITFLSINSYNNNNRSMNKIHRKRMEFQIKTKRHKRNLHFYCNINVFIHKTPHCTYGQMDLTGWLLP